MTTRGTNPSISPPVQIPQPRQLSTLPSGTPPPNQQLYHGQSSGIVQGPAFHCIPPQQQYPQGETLLSYQAYGSAPNDLRAASASSGRGGAGPGNMAQPGAFYHQPNQNMRPSQPPPPNQQYYINPSGQNAMRHSRPTHPSNQPMLFIQQNNNMVMPANMYQHTARMPLYQSQGPQYPARYPGQGMVYFGNSVPRGPSVLHMQQTTGMGPQPAPREKRLITISDPNTGRNITDELIKSQHQHAEDKNDQEDSSANNDKDAEIRKNFTRQVVERMKTQDSSSPQLPAESVNPQAAPVSSQNHPSQDSHQLPPFPPGPHPQKQPQQSAQGMAGGSGPGPMIRPPPMRLAGSAPINLSVPPPQLPPSVVYSNNRHAQNQQGMSNQLQQSTMPQPQPQQVLQQSKSQLPPQSAAAVVMVDSAPQTRPSADATATSATHEAMPIADKKPQLAQTESNIPPIDIPKQTAAGPAVPAEKSNQKSSVQDNPPQPPIQNQAQDHNVPVTITSSHTAPAPVVSAVKQTSPVTSESMPPAPVQPATDASSLAHPKVEAKQPSPEAVSPEVTSVVETSKQTVEAESKAPSKEEAAPRANIQGNKDGRKGKKGKKDFSRKESGGSEMDAFIDKSKASESNGSAQEVVTEKLADTVVPSVTPISRDELKPSIKDTENETYTAPVQGKDSGVDSESGIIAEQQKQTESRPKEKASASPSPQDKDVKDADQQQLSVEKENSPVPEPVVASEQPEKADPVKESKFDNYVAEKEIEVVKSDIAKIQNGSDMPQTRVQVEKQASVPKEDSSIMKPVQDDKAVDKGSDDELSKMDKENSFDENGTPKIEDMEVSKAEEFAKLKKSGGKLVYDRAYLMELRECASSQTKPDGLPKLDIILDKPNPLMLRPSGGPADFTPAFFHMATNQRHAPPIGKSSSRGRQRPGEMPGTPRVIKSISMSNDTKTLHQSENPWKPTKKDEKDEHKTLEAEMLFIMNRLTPTNFEKMALEMKKLGVKTYEDLQLMIKIFFDKATIETKFVEAYALLCKVMSGLKVPPPADGSVKEHLATFRVVMLTKCQQEFEADKTIIFEDPEEKKKKLEAEYPENTPGRIEKIDNILYQMKLKRMKFYGNIRFIGELFKLSMLTENIMHDCIYRLLKARDDDSLVSLSNLLTTVGRNLETEKAKPRMDQYFSQIAKIADERKSRIKFTLRDVIELRQNHWIPRKEATGPKKINEVHKDFAQEQARNQFLASQPPPPRNDSSQAGSRRGSRQRPDDKPNDEGWNTVSSKSVRMIDASKMKFSSKSVVDDNIQLGPGGGVHRQTLWGRGSHGGAQPSQDDRPSVASNRFSALTSDDSRRQFLPRSPSRGEGSGGAARGMRQGPTVGHGRGKIMSRSSQEGDKRDLFSNARSYMGGRSQNSSRDNSWNRDDRRQFMGSRGSGDRDNPMIRSDSSVNVEEFRAPAPAVKQMTESEIETKASNILDEYLNIKDINEAKLCVKELTGQNMIYCFVTACINNVLEKKEASRQLTGNLFHELVSNNTLNSNMYIKGLSEVLQYASDMVVDIPTLWNNLAQVICPLLVGGSLPWSKLKQALSPHLDNKDGGKLLAAILSNCVNIQGEKEVSQQWQNSGLSWSSYLKQDDINEFVADKKLDFTLGGSQSSLGSDLEEMIRNRKSSDEVVSFIEKTVRNRSDNSFIRALTTAVVSASLSESKELKFNEDVLKNYKDVMQKYLGSTVELQLQALYAIQTLIAKLEHPSGLLSKLFELLYYEISVEEEAFYKWENSSDPQEQEAKGICMMQVRQFFIWLKENEDPES